VLLFFLVSSLSPSQLCTLKTTAALEIALLVWFEHQECADAISATRVDGGKGLVVGY
jgi:hypothetical protein